MEIGQRCVLYPASINALRNSHDQVCGDRNVLQSSSSITKAVGVIIGKQKHIEDANRVLYYFHCLSIELPSEYRAILKRESSISKRVGIIKSYEMRQYSNEINCRGTHMVSGERYKYRFNGWYDACHFYLPSGCSRECESNSEVKHVKVKEEDDEAALLPIQPEWIEAMEQQIAPCEVRFLCYAFQPWFESPFDRLPHLTLPERGRCYSVYICHRCLAPFFSQFHLTTHLQAYCDMYELPGKLLYFNLQTGQKVFYVDGARHLQYGRNLSLLGKLFIESKLLDNDVDLYEFFITTIPSKKLPFLSPSLGDGQGANSVSDQQGKSEARDAFRAAAAAYDAKLWKGDVLMGYFSRLKQCDQTLSCIAVLPPFQKMKLGFFLLDVAYRLTKIRQEVCGCSFCGKEGGYISRPFSPHGQELLLAYWSAALRRAVCQEIKRSATIAEKSVNFFTIESIDKLRSILDIPIHQEDFRFLLVHDSCSFYSSYAEGPQPLNSKMAIKISEKHEPKGSAVVGTLAFEAASLLPNDKNSASSSSLFRFKESCFLRDSLGGLLYSRTLFHD